MKLVENDMQNISKDMDKVFSELKNVSLNQYN